MEPLETIAQITQDLINLIMLRERDFFLRRTNMFEVSRVKAGGYFQNIKTIEISIYVIINRIKQGKRKNPLSVSRSIVYELRQIFNSRFLEIFT